MTGARTDAVDARGRTALHLAVSCSCRMVERLLPLAPALLDAADAVGRTPLHCAAEKGARAATAHASCKPSHQSRVGWLCCEGTGPRLGARDCPFVRTNGSALNCKY